MKKTFASVQAQIQQLQLEAEALKAKEKHGVISRIKEAIEVYGLTTEDLFPSGPTIKVARKSGRRARSVAERDVSAPPKKRRGRASSSAGKSVPVKYSDGKGNEWSGRGSQPRWLKAALSEGKGIESFLVSR